jgi:hypothetical protein
MSKDKLLAIVDEKQLERPKHPRISEIHEWYAKEIQTEVSNFNEIDLHVCNVIFKYLNDKGL